MAGSSESVSACSRNRRSGWQQEEMLVIETNIDDMNPQFFEHVMDRLFEAGARDVFFSPIQMKKNRPAVLVRVIAEPRDRDRLAKDSIRGNNHHWTALLFRGPHDFEENEASLKDTLWKCNGKNRRGAQWRKTNQP